MREVCPRDNRGSLEFIWGSICILLYPIGLPLGLVMILDAYNVPTLSNDIMHSSMLKAFLDHLGVPNDVSPKRCFYQNLISNLGSPDGMAKAAKLNKKYQHEDRESEESLEEKEALLRLPHDEVEKCVAKLLDVNKMRSLQAKAWIHFVQGTTKEVNPKDGSNSSEDTEEEESVKEDIKAAIHRLYMRTPGQGDGGETHHCWQGIMGTCTGGTTTVTIPEGVGNHDDILDLIKLLLDDEKIGMPACGWVDDNDFDDFDHFEEHPGRSFHHDLKARWAMMWGRTDLEHFSDRDFQVSGTTTACASLACALCRLTPRSVTQFEKGKAMHRAGFLFEVTTPAQLPCARS
eukprot:249579-Rhodomonas_salina.1